MTSDQRTTRAEPGPHGARVLLVCTPTMSKPLDSARGVGSSPRRPLLRGRQGLGPSTARSTAAPTGPPRMLDEIGDVGRVRPSWRGKAQGPADGLRSPGIEQLRPEGEAHQAGRRRSARPARHRPDPHPSSSSGSPWRTTLRRAKLYPNVDFDSADPPAMGFPTDLFTVLFAIGRLPGWIARWGELLTDPEQKIARPRQVLRRRRRAALCCRSRSAGWTPRFLSGVTSPPRLSTSSAAALPRSRALTASSRDQSQTISGSERRSRRR